MQREERQGDDGGQLRCIRLVPGDMRPAAERCWIRAEEARDEASVMQREERQGDMRPAAERCWIRAEEARDEASVAHISGCGRQIRTADLWDMNPVSYLTALSRVNCCEFGEWSRI